MSKYDRLGAFLRDQKTQMIPMTFSEIERILGTALPASSQYPAWWSNNPSNNVMTKIWLDAGFKTEQIDIPAKRLVFRKAGAPALQQPPAGTMPGGGLAEPARAFTHGRHPVIGALKGIVRILGKTDLTKPADPDWGAL